MPKNRQNENRERNENTKTRDIKTKNKNRAKGINKRKPPRRAQKRQKMPFPIIVAYYRQKAAQYRCNMSVLCLYCRSIISVIGGPYLDGLPLR